MSLEYQMYLLIIWNVCFEIRLLRSIKCVFYEGSWNVCFWIQMCLLIIWNVCFEIRILRSINVSFLKLKCVFFKYQMCLLYYFLKYLSKFIFWSVQYVFTLSKYEICFFISSNVCFEICLLRILKCVFHDIKYAFREIEFVFYIIFLDQINLSFDGFFLYPNVSFAFSNVCFDVLRYVFWNMFFELSEMCVSVNRIRLLYFQMCVLIHWNVCFEIRLLYWIKCVFRLTECVFYISECVFWSDEICVLKYVFWVVSNVCFCSNEMCFLEYVFCIESNVCFD